MKRTLMALALVLAATPVWANSITVVSSTSGAGWQPFGTVNNNGRAIGITCHLTGARATSATC